MSREIWEVVETKVRKIEVVKTKRGEKKRRGWKETRRERGKKERKEKTQEKTKDGD